MSIKDHLYWAVATAALAMGSYLVAIQGPDAYPHYRYDVDRYFTVAVYICIASIFFTTCLLIGAIEKWWQDCPTLVNIRRQVRRQMGITTP